MCKYIFIFPMLSCLSAFSQPGNKEVTFKEDTIKVAVNGGSLEGNLVRPKNSNSLVIIVAGSGPTDRNGNSPLLKGKNNLYRQIAENLALKGISSFRYDKRGAGKGLSLIKSEQSLRFDDYVNDLLACLDTLQHQFAFKKIYLAGHSEGSLIAMIAATQRKITGYISLAGTSQSIDKTLQHQLLRQPDSLQQKANDIMAHLRKGDTVSKVPFQLFNIFRPSIQPYMISWMKHDPEQVIARLDVPILIVHGTTDIQVPYTEAEDLHKANPKNSTTVIIKNFNHVFKEAPEDYDANFNTYSNPDLLVSGELIDAIIEFIRRT